MKIHELSKLLAATSAGNLRALAVRYAEAVWRDGWKPGKQKALQDAENPFLGGPMDLGVSQLRRSDGSVLVIGPLTRIRMRDLDDTSLDTLGVLRLKGKVDPGADIVHPEFVATWTENVANDDKHLLNNVGAVLAVVDTLFSFFAVDEEMADMPEHIDAILEGVGSEVFSCVVRMAWLGRAAQDGSWEVSADCNHYAGLGKNAADLDPYVVAPVLRAIQKDFADMFFSRLLEKIAA